MIFVQTAIDAMRPTFGALGVAVAVAALAGCASISEDTANAAFVAPGKYDVYDCRALATAIASTQDRELELRQLMERSSQSPGGEIVNALARNSSFSTKPRPIRTVRAKAAGRASVRCSKSRSAYRTVADSSDTPAAFLRRHSGAVQSMFQRSLWLEKNRRADSGSAGTSDAARRSDPR
jgi:hypothetical protein